MSIYIGKYFYLFMIIMIDILFMLKEGMILSLKETMWMIFDYFRNMEDMVGIFLFRREVIVDFNFMIIRMFMIDKILLDIMRMIILGKNKVLFSLRV